ncbi:hypothetical protein O9929_18660 [Vibrio lentus]|nr:hypothetical protein [Vibrio lentus]
MRRFTTAFRLRTQVTAPNMAPRFEDTISAIQTRIAEDSSTTGIDPADQPFLSGLKKRKTAAVDRFTDAHHTSFPGNNVDIDNYYRCRALRP